MKGLEKAATLALGRKLWPLSFVNFFYESVCFSSLYIKKGISFCCLNWIFDFFEFGFSYASFAEEGNRQFYSLLLLELKMHY
jgi:hypothetical protein